MLSPELYTEINLPGDLSVRIIDHTRVYFGDYYLVRLEVRCEIPLSMHPEKPEIIDGEPPYAAVYSRFLERMAVPSAAVEDVRQALLAEFNRNALPYLATPDFPTKLVARTIARQTTVKKRYTASGG